METDVLESPFFYRLLAWFETHRKHVLAGFIGVAVAGFAVGFYFWQQNEKEAKAGEVLSGILLQELMAGAQNPGALLKFAAQNPNTSAGARARLLGAKGLFEENKFADAQAQFQKFFRDYPDSPFRTEAQLGVASCLAVQGKINEAFAAYNQLIQGHPTDSTVSQAKFALADLFEAQGKWEQARNLFDEIYRSNPYGSIGSEAGARSSELTLKHPAVPAAPAVSVPTNAPALNLPKP